MVRDGSCQASRATHGGDGIWKMSHVQAIVLGIELVELAPRWQATGGASPLRVHSEMKEEEDVGAVSRSSQTLGMGLGSSGRPCVLPRGLPEAHRDEWQEQWIGMEGLRP